MFRNTLSRLHYINFLHRTTECSFHSSTRFNNVEVPIQDVQPNELRRRVSRSKRQDVSDILNLEANLFENSSHQNNPVNSRKLLEQFKKKTQNFSKNSNKFSKIKSNEDITSTVVIPQKQVAKVKSDIITNSALGIPYTKLHLNDPWLHTLLLAVKSRKTRVKKHQLLIEGRRLILEALSVGLEVEYILFSDLEEIQTIKEHLPSTIKLLKVPQTDLRFWSNLSTCPGVMGIFTKPQNMSEIWQNYRHSTLPITVICDQIREPNNIGSIIRNCAAIACERVIVTKGCADPWDSKALRGGAGAQFRVPVVGPIEWSSVKSFLPNENCFIYLAENNKTNAMAHQKEDYQPDLIVPYTDISYVDKNCVIIIGGETHGLSSDAYRLLTKMALGKCIQIPLAQDVDSLNTASALAVILFEIKKQMLAEPKK